MLLQHYTRLMRQRLGLILAGIILCTGTTFVISNHATTIYEASTLIKVTAPTANNGNDVFSNQALAVSDALLVTSDDVLRAAAKVLPDTTFAQLQKAVSASPANNTELIDVRGDATSPDLAAIITNTVAQTFIQHQVVIDTTRLQATADQISHQLVAAKTNVDQTQAKLSALQISNTQPAEIDKQTNLLSTYQLNYNSLLTNYNAVQLQKATTAQSLTVVQPATSPAQPLGSRTSLNTALAAVLSLLLMIILVLLLDWADTTLKTPEDVAQLALLEPLGSIPFRADNANSPPISNLSANDKQLEHALAIINANFNALNVGQRSLLVTSLHAHAGTTTVATRLAITLAQSGIRVLLVDAHIQQPALHSIFNLPNMRGLTTCQADVHVLQKQPNQVYNWLNQWATTEPNLWLLPAGTAMGNSTALLRSPELRKLITWLLQPQETSSGHTISSSVDIILFDTPALNEEADALILAPLCDSTILVVEAAKEHKEDLLKAQATLNRMGTPILGVVINRQKASHHPYLYINQPQQGVFPTEAPAPKAKYPYNKVNKIESVASKAETPKVEVPKVETPKAEKPKDVRPKDAHNNGEPALVKPLLRTMAQARGKDQGGN